eukprot:g16756.t1
MGDCPSDDECEIVYDDDEEEVPAAPAPAPAPQKAATAEETPLDWASDRDSDGDSSREGGGTVDGADGLEGQPAAAEGAQEGGAGLGAEREGLEHREKVLDDGYEKQDMLKWRDAEVIENIAASADDRCRLLTLSLVRHKGLEHDFSRAAWLDNYKVPGQFVGIRLDDGGDGGVAGCLVAVSTEPLSVRRNDGAVQVLVTEEPSFRLKGDTRGAAEEAKGRSLAALEEGDRVKMSDFMGRGFASLFVGWIGLQSALQEQRDIVIVASGARGLGSVKPVLDWPPVQAHAGIKKVSVFLESESPDTAPFLDDFGDWRSSGIRVTQCFTDKTNENPVDVEAAIFSHGAGLAGAVGGNPGAASFLMAGLPGKRAMELTDRLTDHGVDPSRLLFNDFF